MANRAKPKILMLVLGVLGFHAVGEQNTDQVPGAIRKVAAELGYTSFSNLKDEYAEFRSRVKAGALPTDYGILCRQKFKAGLCTVLQEYLLPNQTPKIGPQSNIPIKLPPFQLKNLEKLQIHTPQSLMRAIPNFTKSKLQNWSESAFKTTKCPKNLNLALALELEQKAPQSNDWVVIDRLWQEGLSCLPLDNSAAEYLHLRGALSQVARNNFNAAKPLLEKALQAEKKNEEYRTLYWLYRIHKELKEANKVKEVVKRLGDQFPLSWYWINVAHEENIDPIAQITKRGSLQDHEEASAAPSTQLFVQWTIIASELENSPSELKFFWEHVSFKVLEEKNFGLSQYMARVFDKLGMHRFQILLLSKASVQFPDKLNKEHLNLLFPKPFYESMKQHSGSIDTAIILGLARQESGFDTEARSSANARGLMQLLHSTARSMNRGIKQNDLYNYDLNIQLGSKYISKLLKRFENSMELSLASYNAGSTNVAKWKERYAWVHNPQLFIDFIPFRETRDYVPSVLRNAYWYHKLFPTLKESATTPVTSGQMLDALLQKPSTK